MPQVIVIIHLMPVFEVVQKRFSVFECHIFLLSNSCDGSSRHTFVAIRLQCTVSGHSDASENATETDHSTRKSGASLRDEGNSYRNPIQLLPDSQEIIVEDTEQSPALVDQGTRSQGPMQLINPRPVQEESYSDLPSRRYVDSMEQVTAQSTQIMSTRTSDRVGMEVDIPKAGLHTPTTLRDPDGETVVDILPGYGSKEPTASTRIANGAEHHKAVDRATPGGRTTSGRVTNVTTV